MPRPVVAKDPWGRWINHRTPTAPKGQNEIAQGRAKRRPGYPKGSITWRLTKSQLPQSAIQQLAYRREQGSTAFLEQNFSGYPQFVD